MAEVNREKIKEPLQSEFESLPLDEKIANLLKMEAVTISESFAYAVRSSSRVVEKVGDVITEVGEKIETEAKKVWQAADSHVHAPCGEPESKGETKAKRKNTKKGSDKA